MWRNHSLYIEVLIRNPAQSCAHPQEEENIVNEKRLTIGIYIIAPVVMLIANRLLQSGQGIGALSHDQLETMLFTAYQLIAWTIWPEARSSGFWSGVHWWRQRSMKTLMWLTAPLALRGVSIYIVASLLGLEHPLIVAGALVATDPAAVGLALGLVGEARYLAGMSWQLTVESLYNDVIGVFVIGIGIGLTGALLGVMILMSIVYGLGLAIVLAIVAELLRVSGLARYLEVPILSIVMLAALYYLGLQGSVSPLFVSVIAASGFDVLDAVALRNPVNGDRHRITHQWEWANRLGLAGILGLFGWLFPLSNINGTVIVGSLALLGSIVITRFLSAYGEERGQPIVDNDSGLTYGPEVNKLIWMAGSTCLGVPMLGAIELYLKGDVVAGSMVFTTIGLSLLLIPVTVLMFVKTEREFAPLFVEALARPMATPGVTRLVTAVRRRQSAHRTADHPEVPHES